MANTRTAQGDSTRRREYRRKNTTERKTEIVFASARVDEYKDKIEDKNGDEEKRRKELNQKKKRRRRRDAEQSLATR